MNLVSLPGLHEARDFQHHVLHKKIRRNHLPPEIVALPDLTFQRQIHG